MSNPPIQLNPQVQQQAQEISATLAQLVKNPPDLAEYMRQHAACLERFLGPVGLIYEMRQAGGLQRIHVQGAQTLEENQHPEQVQAFRRAAQQVVEQRAPVVLAPQTQPVEPLHGLQTGDVPAPHRLPVFNLTDYTHFFLPIPVNNQVAGVLHAWFTPAANQEDERNRIILLQRAAMDIELYLRALQVSEVSEEIVRLTSYSRCLEEMGGDFDLSSVSRKLLEYAKDASFAQRVDLLLAKHYQQNLQRQEDPTLHFNYELMTSIGQQPVMTKSEQAQILGRVGEYLLEKISASQRQLAPAGPAPISTKSGNALLQAAPGKRPQFEFPWIRRDQSTEDSSQIAQQYLETAPMNWVTALPLVDVQQRVCGIILFEGKDDPEKTAQQLMKMQALAYSGGHALSTALFWEARWTLKAATKWINWKDGTLSTPQKRIRAYITAPLIALILFLTIPIPFKIKGDARVRPEEVIQLVAENPTRITAVSAHEGETVRKGQLLLQLDTYEAQLELRKSENEYVQALAEEAAANAHVDEAAMEAARLRASRAAADMERIQYRIDRASVRAPFDGVVLGPKNLAQKVGSVPQMGEDLVEIGSTNSWEVKISFIEPDMALLRSIFEEKGNIHGVLKLTADPDKKYAVALTNIAQLDYGVDLSDNEYRFCVVTDLPAGQGVYSEGFIRAGFSGRAAFYVGWRPIGYILLHDWVRSFKVNWL